MNLLSVHQIIVIAIISILNINTLYLFYSDKQRAVQRKYRVSEKKLLTSTALLGGIGAWIGMTMFRHKTKHLLFRVLVPFSALLTAGILICIVFY